eukprot:Rhum_TRINITY_DN14839_c0_g1::Rhum_TRINITY_DN14839_c0_g1_i2::g.121934::m.121934/K11251/H2A; histone H2A
MAGSGKKSAKRKATGGSSKTGLKFNAGSVGGQLKRGRFAKRVSRQAAVYLAAAMEFATLELLELATKVAAKKGKAKTIRPRHIALAVRNDAELAKLLGSVTIAAGGVAPNVHPALAKRK